MPKNLKTTGKKTPQSRKPAANPLKRACIVGLVLAVIVSWSMVIFVAYWGKGERQPNTGGNSTESGFARELRDYDLYNAPKRALEGGNPDQIEKRLLQLQKKALGVEENLSVLKRRRALALVDRRFTAAYEKAAMEAAKTYPASAPLAAVAADAVVNNSPSSLSDDKQSLLIEYASRLKEDRFNYLALSLYTLAGAFEDPDYATKAPEKLFSLDFSGFPEQLKRDLDIDDFLVKAVKGDSAGASYRLNTLLASSIPPDVRAEITRMGAEFYYDNNDPLKAGELFSRLAAADPPGDEGDYERIADSLAVAGQISGARNIWLALAAQNRPDAVYFRSLYNLASASADRDEEKSWLEKLFSRNYRSSQNPDDSIATYSAIRYTRLLDTADSIAALEQIIPGQGVKPGPQNQEPPKQESQNQK
ncbi:MAG: hypothetical protein FWF26_03685, partial [Treponema sp.]|nr:hypothetical protein [Treponema sp.]